MLRSPSVTARKRKQKAQNRRTAICSYQSVFLSKRVPKNVPVFLRMFFKATTALEGLSILERYHPFRVYPLFREREGGEGLNPDILGHL
jgi:hypothetical protein